MAARSFRSVLIANRGEIACRIAREAQARGFRAIAVYSDADAGALHSRIADDAARIGPAAPRESYLNVAAVLAAAKAHAAEAVHPGYGFLAENAEFAQAVIDAGLVWIGPSPAAIRAMGDKGEAKKLARAAGVPLIPGYEGADQTDARLQKEAEAIGWPVLIKAAMGGGGRGQRRVTRAEDFAEALASARREALSAFSDERMILEKALDRVRHVEFQVFGDAHGNVVHLGERDCSVQRRNQKIIEEAPSPAVTPALRAQMGAAAVALAKAVSYENAGTVEFLVDAAGAFYFLEMNTRIQVEHPVTEAITGLNLIQMQFDAAMGKKLALTQNDVAISGHAIETRLCAEDPADGFRPQAGALAAWTIGGARVDAGFGAGDRVPSDYDSMLAKIIYHGPTRADALHASAQALKNARVLGLATNRAYLVDLLNDPVFAAGDATTGWLGERTPFEAAHLTGDLAAAAALALAHGQGEGWSSTGARRSLVTLAARGEARVIAVTNGAVEGLTTVSCAEGVLRAASNGHTLDYIFACDGARIHVAHGAHDAVFEDITYAPAEPKGAGSDGVLKAPMDGKIAAVRAEPGAPVKKGDVLVILEAMKMEHEIAAGTDGIVESISVKPGDQVSARQVLAAVAPASAG